MAMFKRQAPFSGRALVGLGVLFSLAVFSAGCALFVTPHKPTLLKTKTLIIYPDRVFNQGMALPLDICYIPLKGSATEVTAVPPDQWFAQHKRDKYPFKKALSIRPGHRRPITVHLKPPADTQDLVLVADFINLKGAKGQRVVITAPGKPQEVLFVTDKGIYR